MRGVPCGFVIPADALIFMFGGLLSSGFVIFLHIFGIFWDHPWDVQYYLVIPGWWFGDMNLIFFHILGMSFYPN